MLFFVIFFGKKMYKYVILILRENGVIKWVKKEEKKEELTSKGRYYNWYFCYYCGVSGVTTWKR